MGVQPIQMLIGNGTLLSFCVLLGIVRWMIIWRTPRTRARNLSEVAVFIYWSTCVATLPMLKVVWQREVDVKNAHPDLPDEMILFIAYTPTVNKVSFTMTTFYVLEMWCIKMAFITLFYDFRVHLSNTVRWILYAASLWTVLTFMASFIYLFTACKFSDINKGTCIPALTLAGVILISVGNITTDLFLLTVGISIIRSLKVSSRVRTGLWSIPVVGVIPMVATIIRFVLAVKACTEGISMEKTHEIFIYSDVELTVAWIAFSIPAFRSLIIRRQDANESRPSGRAYLQESLSGRIGRLKKKAISPYSITVEQSFDIHSGSATELTSVPRGTDVEAWRAS